ncbi:hypothetical protein OEA41_001235 [Lepraria neglecta]|uniref:Major facilitator superfamily (MFS) profile domain-containing protein n=1 Tax=Lepraria neglecta TaxID=209136 RepID=A0AAE0DQ75_9LECA|nr:hypothetical protein OEA41_001235 [Lepraria neglecta]
MDQQLTGINVLCYYLPLVLHKSVGLPEFASRLLSTGFAVLYMFATAACVFLIERLGRRPLLMSMAAAQAIAMLGIAVSTELGHDREALIPGIVATVFITFYFLAFGFGWVATPWLYPAEINSLGMRTKDAALATACDWLFNYFVIQTTPIGIHYLKWGLYLVYAILNACFVPFIYYFIVETAGKSLEQIDKWFAANPGWLVHKAGDIAFTEINGAAEYEVVPAAGESESMVKAYEQQDGDTYDEDMQPVEDSESFDGDYEELEAGERRGN